MEVGFATAHSALLPQRLWGLKTRRDLRAGYRPNATLAGAHAPCTNVFLFFPFALESLQILGHRAATTNASAQAFPPNNCLKAVRFAHLGPAKSGLSTKR